MCGCNLK